MSKVKKSTLLKRYKSIRIKPKSNLTDFIKCIPMNIDGDAMSIMMRKKIIVILRDVYGMSFVEIGKILGYCDHTTPIHHYKSLKKLLS